MTEEIDLKRTKTLNYYKRLNEGMRKAFTALYQEIAGEPDPEFNLINMAALTVAIKSTAGLALECQMSEDQLIVAIKAALKDAHMNAPKFG